ncbi:hypothetical protein TPHA_0F03630 [Tetrapisispora phaffii CBS 4417]|uniref:Alpha-1,6-mannosyltransferase n=1 Tax=Tetrapisispora phaffii (strain ATCC 24235 / CBS 4417 / NBRC 1672 / NRRL Y-8282 / UCD 70-5) TaxID=1071381 RepID=G8BUQ7_TETPH|nr:hypothetical protein TPHA_0F03630 [Tetrapisispora phaffii CBS 4417]CCE63843.1 hypothetical protein TPHA_0F03630 [Tetrapisispora phaffii CBS 4417]
MSKRARKNSIRTKILLTSLFTTIITLIFVKVVFFMFSSDVDISFKNLNAELSGNLQSTNLLTKNKGLNGELYDKIEELANQIIKEQSLQTKELDKQRRYLEKKINSLKELPARSSQSLREKLTYQFEYDSSKKFPAYIWQIFTETSIGNKKTNEVKNEDTLNLLWGDKNPGFVDEVFDNNEVIKAMIKYHYSNIPEILEAFESLPSEILKVDFFKFLLLLARGGTYVDSDTIPLIPIPNWIPESINTKDVGLLIGIEHDSSPANWEQTFARRLQFGTWIIQAKPGHPVIKEMVARITEFTLKRKSEDNLLVNVRNDVNVMNWTGAGIWTDILFSYFNDYLKSGLSTKVSWKEFHLLENPKLLSDVLVFPAFSFNAPKEITNQDPNKSYYFCHHEKKKSWKNIPKVEN